MDGKIIRIENHDELEKCLEIIHASYRKRDEDMGFETYQGSSLLHLEELVDIFDKGVQMYGYYEEEMVAFLSFENKENEIKILDIAVLPEHQNKGIGKVLLDFVKENAEQSDKEKVTLSMMYENQRLRKWYEESGFTVYDTIKRPHMTWTIAFMQYKVGGNL